MDTCTVVVKRLDRVELCPGGPSVGSYMDIVGRVMQVPNTSSRLGTAAKT
jgi:hypothetical protein